MISMETVVELWDTPFKGEPQHLWTGKYMRFVAENCDDMEPQEHDLIRAELAAHSSAPVGCELTLRVVA